MLETVRVEAEGFSLPYKTINKKDYDPGEHTIYEDAAEDSTAEDLTYDYSQNGYWSVYKGGEEVESGRGKEALIGVLQERGAPNLTPQEIAVTDS